MSLINDALKRAKQAQQEGSDEPPPVPTLRPVERSSAVTAQGAGVLVPIALVTLAILGLALFWVLWKKQSSPTATQPSPVISVAARSSATGVPQDVPSSGTAPANAVAAPNVFQASHVENATTGPANPGSSGIANHSVTPVTGNPDSTETNHVMASEPAPPAPTPLKLQSIVYNPKSPSAMINGRVVFVGDKIRDLRVMAIHRGDVVLTGAGRTNLLSLEP